MKTKACTLNEFDGQKICFDICYVTKRQKCLCYTLSIIPLIALISILLACLVQSFLISDPFQRSVLSSTKDLIEADEETQREWAKRLGGALQFQTVSFDEEREESTKEPFLRLHDYIENSFPNLSNVTYITYEKINNYSLLYRIEGTSKFSLPYMFSAHLDVVPIGDYKAWTRDPFLGEIVNREGKEYIYGRGALDSKHIVLSILEALNVRVAKGQRPLRTFYIALGHDEELNGKKGGREIGKRIKSLLKEHNEKSMDFILDEGMMILNGYFPFVSQSAAYIGVAEKGYLNIELSANGPQSHSSIPPFSGSSIGIVAHALSKLENTFHPSRFGKGPELDTLKYLAPHASFFGRFLYGNMWLFQSLIGWCMSLDPSLNALIRTTTSPTRILGGDKRNTIPSSTKAVINHRIYPSDTVENVLDDDRAIIHDDRIIIKVLDFYNPPPISPYANNIMPFQIVANSILDVFENVFIVPGTMVASTDSKHYSDLTNKIYRFSPLVLSPRDSSRIHGVDEMISIENYNQCVQFYYRIMINAESECEENDCGSGSGDGDETMNPDNAEDYKLEITEDSLQE